MAEQIDKITKHRLATSKISTIISVTLVLFMMGILGVVLINAKKVSDSVRENIGFEVMLSSDISDGKIKEIEMELSDKKYIKSATFVSKEEASKEMIDLLGHDFRDIVGDIIPPSFLLKINAEYTTLDSLQQIEKELNLMEDVMEVNYQQSYVNHINENLRTISIVLLSICFLLLIISIALINNTIRLSIYSKRFLIRTMLLVGAKRKTIYKPFIVTGIVQGLWGGLLAIIALSGVLYFVYEHPILHQVIDLSTPEYYGILFVILFVLGLLITWLSTVFSVRKYIKMKIDKLYF